MKIKNGLFLILFIIFIYSCDMGPNMNFDSHTVSKIYQYNISDSSTTYMFEGFSPIVLPKTNKMLYVYSTEWSSELWLYDFSTSEKFLLSDNSPFINEYSFSSNEKYISFVEDNKIKRIDLTNLRFEDLFSTNNKLMDYPPAQYSPNGERIICLFQKINSKGQFDSDSLYVNIYNVEQMNSIQLQNVFLRNNDNIKVGFTNSSNKFYISREGYNPNNHRWQIELTIYNNFASPTYFDTKRIYPTDYNSHYSNYNENNLIVLENKRFFIYDINSGAISNEIKFDHQFRNIRFLKNKDCLIGIDELNKIYLINISGEILNTFLPNVVEEIVWADYLEVSNKIIFRTEKYIN